MTQAPGTTLSKIEQEMLALMVDTVDWYRSHENGGVARDAWKRYDDLIKRSRVERSLEPGSTSGEPDIFSLRLLSKKIVSCDAPVYRKVEYEFQRPGGKIIIVEIPEDYEEMFNQSGDNMDLIAMKTAIEVWNEEKRSAGS